MNNSEFLVIKNLKKYFFSERGFLRTTLPPVKAVEGVSLTMLAALPPPCVGLDTSFGAHAWRPSPSPW